MNERKNGGNGTQNKPFWYLAGIMQIIAIGLTAWILLTVVGISDKLGRIEERYNSLHYRVTELEQVHPRSP